MILACLLVPFAACFGLYALSPAAGALYGGVQLLIPAVIGSVSIAIAGSKWTRKHRTSMIETLGGLLLMQVAVVAVTSGAGEPIDVSFELPFVNLLFAPWWFLGHVIGVVSEPASRSRLRA